MFPSYLPTLTPHHTKTGYVFDLDADLWTIPDLIGIVQFGHILRDDYPRAIPGKVLLILDQDETRHVSLKEFSKTHREHSATLLGALDDLKTAPLSELFERDVDIDIDGSEMVKQVVVLQTRYGACAWDLNTHIHTYPYFQDIEQDPPLDEEEATDRAQTALDEGRMCTIFSPLQESAHERFRSLENAQKTFEIWKKVIPGFDSDMLTKFKWIFS